MYTFCRVLAKLAAVVLGTLFCCCGGPEALPAGILMQQWGLPDDE